MQNELVAAMEQLLRAHCTPAQVREIETGGEISALWSALLASGFVDALIAETRGGSGLSLADSFAIAFVSGRHALPVPLAHTACVRGIFSAATALAQQETLSTVPQGTITIANEVTYNVDSIHCSQVPFGRTAQWVLVDCKIFSYLLPAAAASVSPAGGHGSLDADMAWAAIPADALRLNVLYDWRAIGARVAAALLAGAQERVCDMTIAYANTRSQFGKPIAKLQAIQQQLSVMAEQAAAAKMAAQIGFSGDLLWPSLEVAVAKARASRAAPLVAEIAHAVHGAMGFTEEYDLQLFTRRLHEWRMAYGSETYWNRLLGQEVLQSPDLRVLEFLRQKIIA